MPLDLYSIPNTVNINPDESFSDPKAYPNFQNNLKKFQNLVKKLVAEKKSATFYKFGDGDYFFLKGIPYGTTVPGHGALLNKDYSDIDLKLFKKGVLKNDFVAVEIRQDRRKMWKELFPRKKPDFCFEMLPALVYSKWYFKNFGDNIGLIGAKENLELIKKLLKFKEYRDYLGIDKFSDYIEVPRKGTADDIKETEKLIAKQLKKAKAPIFLLGIGHVKNAILYKLTKYHKAIYIDVGVGIDALAGNLDNLRPYGADWVNFIIEGYDYEPLESGINNKRPWLGKKRLLRPDIKDDLLNAAETREKGGMLKHPHYFEIYDNHFKNLPEKKIKILEIGVRKGGSLWMWKKYFPKGKIVGVDVMPDAKKWEGENIEVFIGDQADVSFLESVHKEAGPFDIIIDDGGHMMHQISTSFMTLFPLLKENGIYVVEDTFVSYWPRWGGKLYGQDTVVEMLKSLIDRLSWWAYRWSHAGEFKITRENDFFEANLKSLHFYDGLCFIYKGKATEHPMVWEDGISRNYDI